MKKDKKDENRSNIFSTKKNLHNKLEIAEELHPSKNIGSMLGYRIDKKKTNKPS
ncbi:DNA polymerase III [Clostridioides difficile]|uniref:hypothetical protein n=1 Tax=Clostridioides sp. GD02404 TaxID=3054354 RepID=UPI0006BBD67D|nr:DNA polymerase III [Clostridioides difficile]